MSDKANVLIVDDNLSNILILEASLRDRYHIQKATDGEQCLEISRSDFPPDLILLDIMMPGMDGFEVCRQLKEDSNTALIPIIFVSAKDNIEDEKLGLKLGAVDYITKPIRPLIVAARVETQISLKQKHDKLVEKNAYLQSILDYSPILISTKDLDGNVTMVNKSFEILEGPKAEDYIGKNVYQLLPFETADLLWEKDIIARDGPIEFEEIVYHKGGIPHNYVTTKFPITNSDGKLIGTGAMSKDMTQYVQAEKKLRQIHKMEAVGKLTAGIAHDFNNILSIILGNLELMKFQIRLDEKNASRIGVIERAAQRAVVITKQLLGFSRQTPTKTEAIDVNQIINSMQSLISDSLNQKVIFELSSTDDLWLTDIDQDDLRDALLNLIYNARDAMPDGGKLRIDLKNSTLDTEFCQQNNGAIPGDYLQLIVGDNGHGISEKDQHRIFEPFFTTRAVGKGTGLGLAMVYGFVKRSKGYILVKSKINKGTKVEIYLPRSKIVSL